VLDRSENFEEALQEMGELEFWINE
jgi:hypothetical protein